MSTRTITLTFTGPCVLKLEVPSTTDVQLAGEEIHSTPTAPPEVDAHIKIYEAAQRLADARTDFVALRSIANAFLSNSKAEDIRLFLADAEVNGDEFLGLYLSWGATQVAQAAIARGINISLAGRGQA